MENMCDLRLREKDVTPTSDVLESILGNSYLAYEELQGILPDFEMEQNWQWYTPHKAWYAKGQYFWTTTRGTRKEKVIYWLHVCDGCFCVTVWFKEKNRSEALKLNVSEETKKIIRDAKSEMNATTFPVMINVTTASVLKDICNLIEAKKDLESK